MVGYRPWCGAVALAILVGACVAEEAGGDDSSTGLSQATVSGDLCVWHTVTITFDGPETDETADTNPFTDLRLDVVFRSGNKSVTVAPFTANAPLFVTTSVYVNVLPAV